MGTDSQVSTSRHGVEITLPDTRAREAKGLLLSGLYVTTKTRVVSILFDSVPLQIGASLRRCMYREQVMAVASKPTVFPGNQNQGEVGEVPLPRSCGL